MGPGTLSFYWHCNCDARKVILDFLEDGVSLAFTGGPINWTFKSFQLGAGTHTLRWDYTLKGSSAVGWVDQVSWTGGVPSDFATWALCNGLSGAPADVFCQDRDTDGVANGFEYAFGTNWNKGQNLLSMRMVNGQPIVEVPKQDPNTIPYVWLSLIGCTNLLCAPSEWDLPVDVTDPTSDTPINCDWYAPEGNPDRAYFRLQATLLQ